MSQQTKYRQLSERHALPLFFRPWWLDMVSKNWDALIAEDSDGTLLAAWPFSTDKKAALSLIRNPLLTPYLGPYFFLPADLKQIKRLNREDKIFSAFKEQMPAWDFFSVQCLPGYNNFLPFHQMGFEHTQRVTYQIALNRTEDEIFSAVKSAQRNHIRQAERELSLIDGLPFLDKFYELHKRTLTDKGEKYPYTEAFFKNLIQASISNNAAVVLAAQRPGQDISAILMAVYDHEQMYLLLSATNPEHIHTGAVALLIWEAVKRAKGLGLKIFDFEGSMDPGIELFFRSFGGERTSYLSCTNNRSKLWKLKQAITG